MFPSSTRPSLDHLEVLLDQLQTTQDHYWPILDHLEVCYGYSRRPLVASLKGPPCGPPTLNRTPITGRSCHRRPNGNKMVYWAATVRPREGTTPPKPPITLYLSLFRLVTLHTTVLSFNTCKHLYLYQLPSIMKSYFQRFGRISQCFCWTSPPKFCRYFHVFQPIFLWLC